jgi:hypothetical protein
MVAEIPKTKMKTNHAPFISALNLRYRLIVVAAESPQHRAGHISLDKKQTGKSIAGDRARWV